MGNGALAIGPKLPRPSSTLPFAPCGASVRYVREQFYIHRAEAGAGPVSFDPTLPKLLNRNPVDEMADADQCLENLTLPVASSLEAQQAVSA